MLIHLIYTHNKTDDAKILQEVSKNHWGPEFGGTYIIHVYNGKPEWNYQKYLEDELIIQDNPGHFLGAANMIDAGIEAALKSSKEADFLILTAPDTWLLNTDFLKSKLDQMKKEGKYLAASSWGRRNPDENPSGLSSDLTFFDFNWLKKSSLFPFNYQKFLDKWADLFYMNFGIPTLELCFAQKYFKSFASTFNDNDINYEAKKRFLRILEREPIHNEKGSRTADWPEIGLYTDAPKTKKEALIKLNINLGPNAQKLINTKDLSYYNQH